jgi:hypothetical protein
MTGAHICRKLARSITSVGVLIKERGNNKSEHAKDVECYNGYLQVAALRSRIAMYGARDLRLAQVVQHQFVTVLFRTN